MARQWIPKKKTPPWVMIVIYSVVGYAVIIAAIAYLQYSHSMHSMH